MLGLLASVALPLGLATPWAKAWVLRRATSWVLDRYGVVVQASRLDYDLTRLAVRLDDLTAADPAAPDRPFVRVAHLDVDVAARALLGRPAFDRISLVSPVVTLGSGLASRLFSRSDPTRTPPGPEQGPPARAPVFEIASLEIRDLELSVGDAHATRVRMRGVSTSLRGEGPGRLSGEVDVRAGVSVAFGPESFHVEFDRADATVALDGSRLAVSRLTAVSPAADLKVGGTALLDSGGALDLRYEGTVQLDELGRWWAAAPAWSGRAAVRGAVSGAWHTPRATIALQGTDLRWTNIGPATLEAQGRISVEGLELESASVASPQGLVEARGRLAFLAESPTRVSLSWRSLDAGTLTKTLGIPAAPAGEALASGTAQLSWPGPGPALSTLDGRVQVTTRVDGLSSSPAGALSLEGRRAQWRLRWRQPLAGSTLAALDANVALDAAEPANSRLSGSFTLGSADVSAALAQLHRLGTPIPALAREGHSGRVAFDGELDGTLSSPRLHGEVTVEALDIASLEGVRAHGMLGLDARSIALAPLLVEVAGNRVALEGSLPWSQPDGRGMFEIRLDRPEALASMLPAGWRPEGRLEMSGGWGGSLREPHITARLAGSGLRMNGMTFEGVSGRLELAGRVVRVDDLQLTQPQGRLRASGSLDLDSSKVVLDAHAEHLEAALLAPAGAPPASPPRAKVEDLGVDVRVEGSLERLDGTASLSAGALVVEGRVVGPLSARAAASNGIAQVTADAPLHHTGLEGQLMLHDPWSYSARLDLRDASLAGLMRLARPDAVSDDRTTATLTASVDASGTLTDLAGSAFTLHLRELSGQLHGRPLAVVRRGRLGIEAGTFELVEPLQVTAGALSLGLSRAADPSPDHRLTLTLEGPVEDALALASGLVPSGWSAEGRLQAEVRTSDRLDLATVSGDASVQLSSLRREGREYVRDATLVARAADGTIAVSELTGTVLGSAISGTGAVPLAWLAGSWPAAGAGTSATWPEATLAVRSDVSVAGLLDGLGYKGQEVAGTLPVTVTARATAPRLDALVATLEEAGGSVTLRDLRLVPQAPVRLRFDAGRLNVDAFTWQGPRSRLRASGAVGLLPGVDGALELEGRSSLVLLDVLLPGRAEGATSFDVKVAGPLGDRRASGTIVLESGSLILPRERIALAGWSGTLVFDASRIAVGGLRGQVNGGEVTIDGQLPIGTVAGAARTLNLNARNVFLEFPRGLRTQLDTALQWERVAGRSRVSGRATITAEPYTEPITALARVVAGLDTSSPGAVQALPAWLAATELDVRLDTTGPLTMANSVARLDLSPALSLVGTVGKPQLTGRITIADDGRIQVGGRTYRLRDSRVEFRPASGMVPRLNVTGEVRVGDYTVFLRLSGPANEIETSLSSDPPLGERDVQSLLVTGQTADATMSGSRTDQLAVEAVSADVLGFAGQFLGLDSVKVGTYDDLRLVSSDVDPATRLTVSKRLGAKFELVFSDNLDDSELTWVIIYRPRPGYELRLLSRENLETSVEFRQEVPFGPGVSPRRTGTRRQRVEREKVSAVTVSGEPGFAATDVLSVVELRSGDRFDFGTWLDDRARIEQLYRGRGFYATRIVPTRAALDGAGTERRVALDYRIVRGPRTVLRLMGYEAPPALLEQLRDTWSASVLPDLLDDDVEKVVRDHLADAGYLRAGVGVEVEAEPQPRDVVTATIRIEPGPQTTSRRLVFTGNTSLSSASLEAVARAGGLDLSAWKDPAPLCEAVAAEYGSRGYLAARATAGNIEFSDGTAVLPIRVVEGPAAKVASLTVNGADATRRASALAATDLATGTTYVAGAGQVARVRLERFYRDLGYRDVRVEDRTRIDALRGEVAVAFDVVEGPKYVVRAVRTTGVEHTRPETVARAIAVEPGTPASPSAAAATQRSLYRVGTFRSAEVQFEPVAGAATATTVPVDAVVAVEEARRYLLVYGIETTNEYEPAFEQSTTSLGLAADLRDRNFLGRGWALGAGMRYEPKFKSVRTLFSVPTLREWPLRTSVYATLHREEDLGAAGIRLVDDESVLNVEQRWRPRSSVEVSWGYTADWRDIRFFTTGSSQALLGFKGVLASVNATVVLDRRDSLFDATRGWVQSTSVQWGLRALGSNFDYLRTLIRASHYLPIGPLVVASNARWGNLAPLGGTPPLTAIDLFFDAGGTQTVRGYKQDSLSAYELLGVKLGGSRLLLFNEELRFPLFWRFGAVVFADAGNTFTDERGIDLHDLAVGLGVGLRIRTPLAPLRIDVGFPVPRRPGDPLNRWHFSIGQVF